MLVVSAECPGFQLQNREIVGLRQAAVIKGETGAASAQKQPLVHPQTKVTTGMKRDKFSLQVLKLRIRNICTLTFCRILICTFLLQWQKSPNLL